MKIGVISKEKDADVCSVCTMETREKLPMGRPTHLDRLLKKWNVPNKRLGKGSLYYLKKLSDAEKV